MVFLCLTQVIKGLVCCSVPSSEKKEKKKKNNSTLNHWAILPHPRLYHEVLTYISNFKNLRHIATTRVRSQGLAPPAVPIAVPIAVILVHSKSNNGAEGRQRLQLSGGDGCGCCALQCPGLQLLLQTPESACVAGDDISTKQLPWQIGFGNERPSSTRSAVALTERKLLWSLLGRQR